MRAEFTKVSEVHSEPQAIPETDGWSDHTYFERKGSCPNSTHSKKRHVAKATQRIIVTSTYGNGRTTRSYIDLCTCKFCGFKWNQEWMPAGF